MSDFSLGFVILGAPKCGTTSLAEYLAQHPDVAFSNPKEPHYFNTDGVRGIRDWDEYKKIFPRVNSGVFGEGSTRYLESAVAATNIIKHNSHAKFIVLVRDPAEMAVSIIHQAMWNGIEDARNVEDAWTLQEARREGRHIPRRCPDVRLLMYGSRCSLGTQLQKISCVVPKDQLLVLHLSFLKTDPRAAYSKVLNFLGLPYDGREDFPVVNERKQPRSKVAHLVTNEIAHFKRWLGIQRSFGILDSLRKVNRRAAKNTYCRPGFLGYLREEFEGEQRLIEKYISGCG